MASYGISKFKQGKYDLVFFLAPANEIWERFSINRRIEDKDEGYQRALSEARADKIAKYIQGNNAIPLSILVSLENGKYQIKDNIIKLNEESDVGWIIDGQHRLAGANRSGTGLVMPVIGFLNIDVDEQINQFVTINREAKGVPASLYYDLIKHLPKKTASDQTKERAADIASALKIDEESPFFGKIVVMSSPKNGEISLTTFIKGISPIINDPKGSLAAYSLNEQIKIIDNYYKAINNVFPKYFLEEDPVFFKTTGFGAMFKVFSVVFNYCLKHEKGFTVADASKTLRAIGDYDFEIWKKIGTGNAAEIEASDQIRTELQIAFSEKDDGTKIRL